MENRQIPFDFKPLVIEEEIKGTLEHCKFILKEKKVLIDLSPSLPPNPKVMADAFRLRQILMNLLSNGVKYSPEEEPIKIEVSRKNDFMMVRVADRGTGIPEGMKSRVFEKFFQGDSSNSRAFAGMGMGLSSAKLMVEEMGGSIGFESKVGEGSIFYFTLPFYFEPE